MVNAAMGVPVLHTINAFIGRILIGKDCALREDFLFNDSEQCLLCDIPRSTSKNTSSLALCNSNHWRLYLVTAHRASLTTFAFASHVRLIHFHAVPLQLHIFRKQRANLTDQAPRGFVRHSDFALNLLCRDAAACGSH